MGLSRPVMGLLYIYFFFQGFPAVRQSATEGDYRKKNLLPIVKLSAAQGWVVSATFRQIYSQNTCPVPTVQEASGNVMRESVTDLYLVVMAVVVNQLMACTQVAMSET
jgi:hypothetical protein